MSKNSPDVTLRLLHSNGVNSLNKLPLCQASLTPSRRLAVCHRQPGNRFERITQKAGGQHAFQRRRKEAVSNSIGGVLTLPRRVPFLSCLITARRHEYFRHMLSHFVIGVHN